MWENENEKWDPPFVYLQVHFITWYSSLIEILNVFVGIKITFNSSTSLSNMSECTSEVIIHLYCLFVFL